MVLCIPESYQEQVVWHLSEQGEESVTVSYIETTDSDSGHVVLQ